MHTWPRRWRIIIKEVYIYRYNLKYITPFVTSYGRKTKSYGIILAVSTEEGVTGYGEVHPSPMLTGDTQPEALGFLIENRKGLIGLDPLDIEGIHEFLLRRGLTTQSPKVALDFACYDIKGKIEEKPVYQLLGASKPRRVPTTITISLHTPEETAEIARKYAQKYRVNGIKRIKLKLRGVPKVDERRVRSVAEVFQGDLTLDVNQGFKDPRMAVRLFNRLYDELGERILYVEEPCPRGDLEKLRYVSNHSKIPIFADESAGRLEDVERIVEQEAAKGINIKLHKAGGIYWGTKIARVAEKANMDMMVGGGGTGIAIAAGANFVAGTRNINHADLDTDFYFRANMIKEGTGASFKDGARIPSNRPGLGVELQEWVKALLSRDLVLQQIG